MGNIQWDDLHWERRRYKALKCYCDSKLMNILFTSALALRLKGSGVTANCLHPGAVRSGFAIGQGDFFSRIVRLGGLFLLSPERGAETSLYLATSSEVAETSGAYFARCRPKKPSALARDAHLAERLWEISEQSLRSLDTLPSQ